MATGAGYSDGITSGQLAAIGGDRWSPEMAIGDLLRRRSEISCGGDRGSPAEAPALTCDAAMHSRPVPKAFPLSAVPTIADPAPAKREALLRAALELFAERTYGATPVPEIAARAHVGTGTLYRHFASKEALANEVFRSCKRAMHEAMVSSLDGGGSEKQRFLNLWGGLVALASSDPTALRFLELQHHEDYLDDESRQLSDRVFATAEVFVKDGQRSGALRGGDAGILISLVFGAFVGLFKESCAGRFAFDETAAIDAGDSVWRMIAGA